MIDLLMGQSAAEQKVNDHDRNSQNDYKQV
jgi:hypothetical protein